MADINRIARVNGGVTRNFDLTADTLVMQSLKLGTSELTKAKLDLLAITADSATAVDASAQHHHDGRYRTQSELSSTGATSGADVIGVNNTPSNYSASAQTVQDHLEGIDTALASAGGNVFADDVFRIQDNSDATKEIAFEASGITTGNVRTITMPDSDVDLGEVDTNSTFRTNLGLTTNGNGASLIGIEDAASQFTSTNVEGALTEALDAAQAAQNTADDALPLAGGTMSGAIAMGTNKITGLDEPTAAQDAATKQYVDNIAAGLDPKESVRAASTADVGGTYSSGTITGLGASLTIDGVSLTTDDRVLLKDQTDSLENGIYVYDGTDELTRASDHDGTPSNEVSAGNFTFVEQGTDNADTGWVLQGDGVLTLDTDSLDWVQFSASADITASTGLTKVGNDIQLADAATANGISVTSGAIAIELATGSGLEFASNELQIASDGVTGAKFRLANDEYLRARNAADNADINILKVGTDDEIEIGNGADINFAGDLIANQVGRDIGSPNATEGFRFVYGQRFDIRQNASGTGYGRLESSNDTLPSGANSLGVNLKAFSSASIDGDIGIYTFDASGSVATGNVHIETGNQSGTANSGNIEMHIGSAGNVQGEFKFLKQGNAPTVGQVWTATDTDGSGYWDDAPDSSGNSETLVAGETLTSGNRAVRFADSGETAGRVYFADNDASTDDNFYVVGLCVAAGETAGQDIEVVKSGPITMTAHGFTLGRPVYLGTNGALTSTAPSGADEAVVKVGIARDANTVEVQIQTMGIA